MLNKIIFNFVFLPIILFVGVITSYEDFKDSKIRNRWVLFGLAYSFVVYLTSWFLQRFFPENIVSLNFGDEVFSYLLWNFDKWSINLVISVSIAYILWHYKIWAAGDAKLFITYAALIPMGQYSKVYFNYYFASYLLLLSIFIPATIYIFLKAVFHFIGTNSFKGFKEKIFKSMEAKFSNLKMIESLKVLLGFFCLFLFFRILYQEFVSLIGTIFPEQSILMVIIMLLYRQLSRFFRKKSKFTIFIIILLSIYLIFKFNNQGVKAFLLIANSLKISMLIMLLFPLAKKIINIYVDKDMDKYTPFAIWMFMGALITWFV